MAVCSDYVRTDTALKMSHRVLRLRAV